MLFLGLHVYSPLLAFCLCTFTYFYAELALGLVARCLKASLGEKGHFSGSLVLGFVFLWGPCPNVVVL